MIFCFSVKCLMNQVVQLISDLLLESVSWQLMNFLLCFRCRKMTSKSRTHWKVAFSDSWLNDERFKFCLKKGQDCNKAVCSLCNRAVVDIATIGVCALRSHTKGGKHQERVRNFNPSALLFFEEINKCFLSFKLSCKIE